jgi:hypothetical protein
VNIRVSAANLALAAKDLSAEWQETKNSWHDAKSRELEAAYLEELPRLMARAGEVIQELDALLRKVKSDCE